MTFNPIGNDFQILWETDTLFVDASLSEAFALGIHVFIRDRLRGDLFEDSWINVCRRMQEDLQDDDFNPVS